MSVNDTKNTPIAIVGIGCLFPKAENARRFWANIKNGVDAITEVPPSHWLPEDYFDSNPKSPDRTYARKGGFILPVDFDPSEFGLAPNTLEATDSAQLLGLLAAKMALEDAGYGPSGKEFDRSRVSVILGVTGSLELVIPLGARLGHPKWRRALAEFGITGEDAEAIISRMQEDYVPWQENSFPGLLGNVVAGRIANRFNLGGTNCTVDAACGSSLSAVHMATMELAAGRSSMAITGGVDCFNDIFMYMCFSKTPALSPSGDAKPFDASGDGTTLGEGLGMMALKRLDDAVRDGDRIYAVIKGVGSSSDGKGKAIYAPSAEGQTRALLNAYSVTGVSPDTVELVEAHGTGTTVGDGVEVDALTAVYGATKKDGAWCALGSVKSMIGHTKASAGSAGMIKAALSLYNKTLPPTIKVNQPLKQLSGDATPFYLNTELRPWMKKDHPRRAAVSALGFGGANFHAILEEYNPEKQQPDWDGDAQLVALSAQTAGDIRQELSGWKNSSWDEIRVKAMQSRAAFDASAKARLSFVLENGQDTAKIINAAIAGLDSQKDKMAWSTPEGIFFASGAPQKLAVLFPGQGAQYPGMQRDIACRFPQALNTLAQADAAFGGEKPLSDYMYPRAVFTAEKKQLLADQLRDTRVAQPALGAASIGAYRVLESFGLCANAFAGHSYGELAALCAAGAFDEPTLFALSKLRGSLMAQGGEDRGSMLAVQATLAEVQKTVAEEKLDLVIANKNAPTQFVLSGKTPEIERAAQCFTGRGVKNTKLTVSAAFHSPLVAGAQKEFSASLAKINFNALKTPVYSNKSAAVYPADAAKARELLSAQLACPVEFVAMIEGMHADGIRLFLEVGPGARLTGLVKAILSGKEHTALALDASGGNRSGIADMARSLACLAAQGYPLKLSLWEGGEAAVKDVLGKKISKLAVKLTGANYRTPRPANAPKKPLPRNITLPTQHHYQPAIQPAQQSLASDALRITQESMVALQKLQEQTALLHARFLEGQETAQRSFQSLIEQQKQLFGGAPAANFAPAPLPAAVYAPVAPAAVMPAAAVAKPVTNEANNLEAALLSVVASQTGYPAESLNPDMDMESDLGIDSIKRVAILSELQSKFPNAPKITPEQLGTLRTLRQIMECLAQNMPAAPASTPVAQPASGNLEAALLSIVASQTGYPAESLNPDMDMESDLGIDSIKRVAILSELQSKFPNAPKITPEQLGTLRTLRQIMACLASVSTVAEPIAKPVIATAEQPVLRECALSRQILKAEDLNSSPARETVALDKNLPLFITDDGSPLASAVVKNLEERGYSARKISLEDIGALKQQQKIAALVLLAPAEKLEQSGFWNSDAENFLKQAFLLAQAAGPALRASGANSGACLMTVSRLDGIFGLSGLKAEQNPVYGGLAGLAKTAAQEWPEVSCRALDLAADWQHTASMAQTVADEIFLKGPAEMGVGETGRKIVLLAQSEQAGGGTLPFAKGDVVLITGGARGVTAEAASALAKTCKPVLAIIGRSPLPQTEPDWLSGCATEADIKKALLSRTPGMTPKLAGEQCRNILAAREIKAQLNRFEREGSRAAYYAVDVRDKKAVAQIIEKITRELGPVRGLVHGAGVLADKLIADKTADQFSAVFDTKVTGLANILAALDLKKLKALALYSSSTARFGRTGQCDYAMANEVLNKTARLLARRLPDCRVVSFNWGPWDGGMVNDGLRALFAKEGIGVIGLETGGKFLVDELASPTSCVEVVVIGELPGAQTQKTPAALSAAPAFEVTVSIDEYPFLNSHVINGKAVLPTAIITEWLAHGALHSNPGLLFHGFNNLKIYKGIILNGESCKISAVAGKAVKKEGFFTVQTELRGASGELHAGAEIILAVQLPQPLPPQAEFALAPYPRKLEKAYSEVLFHGEDMRVLRAVCGISEKGIVFEAAPALPPRSWMRHPLRERWLADPAALDAAFQAMILWTFENSGACSLPNCAASYRQYCRQFPSGGVRAIAGVTRSAEHSVTADIDFTDGNGALVARLLGYECTVDKSLNQAFRKNVLSAARA